jgi:hypothetical protein
MGLVILGAIALYLIISIVVVLFSARAAKRHGNSPWRWGGGVALVMYLLVFWDHIPTVLVHEYYCAKEAGFWVYKTVDQWKAENPGVLETLVAYKDGRSANGAYILNQRFNWTVKKTGPLWLNRWRRHYEVVDSQSGELLARYIDFSTGNGNIGGEPPLRFWLQSEYCSSGEPNYGKFLLVKRTFQEP